MKYLLDTNVVSEWVKPRPSPGVVHWLAAADEAKLFLSILTFAEIQRGVEGMLAGRRRDLLAEWLHSDLPRRFDGRIIGVDLVIATAWGRVMARSTASGSNLGVMDGFLAATCLAYDLALVTRNTRHFAGLDLSLANPWAGAPSE